MQDPESKYEALSKYARDLTEAARNGKLDPVIGRDDLIRHAISKKYCHFRFFCPCMEQRPVSMPWDIPESPRQALADHLERSIVISK